MLVSASVLGDIRSISSRLHLLANRKENAVAEAGDHLWEVGCLFEALLLLYGWRSSSGPCRVVCVLCERRKGLSATAYVMFAHL